MPKKYRLTGEEIRKLSLFNGGRAGKRVHGARFSLLIAPLSGEHAKCACVVSKKVAKRAVERNKIQRRCRSLLAKRMGSVKKGVALVLYAKQGARGASFAEFSADIDSLLAKV